MINATPIGSPVAQPTPTIAPLTSAPTLSPVESAANQKPLKPKKKFNWKMILGGLLLLILVAGAGVGLFLSQQSQDIRQQASGNCPGAEIECNDACGWRCLTPNQGKTCENTCSANPPAQSQPPAQSNPPAQSPQTDSKTCTYWCAGCGGFCGDAGVAKGQTCNQQQTTKCGEQPCYITGTCDTCSKAGETRCVGTTLQKCNGTSWQTDTTNSPNCGGTKTDNDGGGVTTKKSCTTPVGTVEDSKSKRGTCGSDGCGKNEIPTYSCSNGTTTKKCNLDTTCNASNCYTTSDKCANGNPQNCELSNSYSNPDTCKAALTSGCTIETGKSLNCQCFYDDQCSSGYCKVTNTAVNAATCRPANERTGAVPTCSSASGRPLDCQCLNSGQCASNYCKVIDAKVNNAICRPQSEQTGDCSVTSAKPNECQCMSNDQCLSKYCQIIDAKTNSAICKPASQSQDHLCCQKVPTSTGVYYTSLKTAGCTPGDNTVEMSKCSASQTNICCQKVPVSSGLYYASLQTSGCTPGDNTVEMSKCSASQTNKCWTPIAVAGQGTVCQEVLAFAGETCNSAQKMYSTKTACDSSISSKAIKCWTPIAVAGQGTVCQEVLALIGQTTCNATDKMYSSKTTCDSSIDSGIKYCCIAGINYEMSSTDCQAKSGKVGACAIAGMCGTQIPSAENNYCPPVRTWGVFNAVNAVLTAAKSNLNTAFMAICPDSAIPGVTSDKGTLAKCQCDVPTPTAGCMSFECKSCGNPGAICASIPDDKVVTPPPGEIIPPKYECNSGCANDGECQSANANFFCNTSAGNKCRLRSNPNSESCQPAVGPLCLNVTLTNLTDATRKTSPKVGDEIQLNCGTVSGATKYIFRLYAPGIAQPVDLQAKSSGSAISESYIINRKGSYKAQCQICINDDCHAFESIAN